MEAEKDVPADLAAYRTATFYGSVIEGHVSAVESVRLLLDPLDVIALVVPGMRWVVLGRWVLLVWNTPIRNAMSLTTCLSSRDFLDFDHLPSDS